MEFPFKIGDKVTHSYDRKRTGIVTILEPSSNRVKVDWTFPNGHKGWDLHLPKYLVLLNETLAYDPSQQPVEEDDL